VHIDLFEVARRVLAVRPAPLAGHQSLTTIGGLQDISSPPCCPVGFPAGAVAGGGLHPLDKRPALSRRTWIGPSRNRPPTRPFPPRYRRFRFAQDSALRGRRIRISVPPAGKRVFCRRNTYPDTEGHFWQTNGGGGDHDSGNEFAPDPPWSKRIQTLGTGTGPRACPRSPLTLLEQNDSGCSRARERRLGSSPMRGLRHKVPEGRRNFPPR